jgi:hypothetical protein
LRIGKELIYYYGCSSYGKNHPDGVRVTGGGIFRSRLRVDGFVSVDGGWLTTPVISCHGNRLTVNHKGPVSVALLNAAGRCAASCDLSGDALASPVAFSGCDFGERIARGARLQFSISEGGELYSFTIHQ